MCTCISDQQLFSTFSNFIIQKSCNGLLYFQQTVVVKQCAFIKPIAVSYEVVMVTVMFDGIMECPSVLNIATNNRHMKDVKKKTQLD